VEPRDKPGGQSSGVRDHPVGDAARRRKAGEVTIEPQASGALGGGERSVDGLRALVPLTFRVEVLDGARTVLWRQGEALRDLLTGRDVDASACDDLEARDTATTEPACPVKDEERAFEGAIRVHAATLTGLARVAYS
jgi:hypothetical protein